MTIQRQFHESLPAVVFDAQGEIHLEEIMNELLVWYQDAQFSSTIPVLFDFSGANWLPMYKEFQQVPNAVVAKVNEHQGAGSVALLVDSRMEQWMMQTIHDQMPWAAQWACFVERGEAEKWLAQEGAPQV